MIVTPSKVIVPLITLSVSVSSKTSNAYLVTTTHATTLLLTATVTIGQLLYSPALFFRANVRIKYKYKYNIPCVTLFIIPFSVRLSFLQGTQGWSKKENILAGSNPQLLLLHRQITYPKKSEHKENIIENGTSVHCVWPLGLQMTHRCTQIQEERGKRRQQRSELTRMVQGTIHLMQQ